MTVRPQLRPWQRGLLATGAAAALSVGVLTGTAPAAPATSPTPAAASLPCDLYAAAGTPCVAAHSTTRALYASYNGPLYQVRRASDNATRDIGVLSRGGYANAAAQDSFCARTTCLITTGSRPSRAPVPGAPLQEALPSPGPSRTPLPWPTDSSPTACRPEPAAPGHPRW